MTGLGRVLIGEFRVVLTRNGWQYLLRIASGECTGDPARASEWCMTETLPDVWSVNGTQLDYEPQYLKQLAGNFQKQQDRDEPQCDAEQQERDTPGDGES